MTKILFVIQVSFTVAVMLMNVTPMQISVRLLMVLQTLIVSTVVPLPSGILIPKMEHGINTLASVMTDGSQSMVLLMLLVIAMVETWAVKTLMNALVEPTPVTKIVLIMMEAMTVVVQLLAMKSKKMVRLVVMKMNVSEQLVHVQNIQTATIQMVASLAHVMKVAK